MRFDRNAYLDLMTFGSFERPMFVELFGLLVGLAEEWISQGASPEEIDLTAFDWDFVPVVSCGGHTGIFGGFKRRILEETREYVVERDELGRKVKLIKSIATLPLPLEYPVQDMASWQKIKPLFEFREERIDLEAVAQARRLQGQGHLVVAGIPGGFDTPRELMGAEAACLAYHIQPELMHDILRTLTRTAFQVLDKVSDLVKIDQLSVHEDLAGKSGPMVSPILIQTFIAPYFKEIWDMLSSKGTRLFDMDSDGNINPILDPLLECGVNSMHPFEPAAGMDIVRVRKAFGNRLAIRGGIDKHVLRQDKRAIRQELEYKMQPLMHEGGTVFGLDHRIPNGTPLENYRYYVDCGREILGIPHREAGRRGWRRMAF